MSKKQESGSRRSNKIMLISCGLALVAALIIGVIVNNVTSRTRLESEMLAINDAFTDGKEQKIEEVLARTVSAGDYAKVEKSLKSYVGDLYKNIIDIKSIADSEAVYDALDGKYLKKNREKLDVVVNELKDADTSIKRLSGDYERLYSEDGVMEYTKKQNLDENFSKLFIENAKIFYDDDNLRKDYNSTLNVMSATIKVEIEAVEYLKNHLFDWEIKDDELKFKNSDTEKAYYKILQKVEEYQNNTY